MNYRILDLTTNTFVSEGLALTPDGKVISIGGVVPEQHMIQQGINFDGISTHEIYEGDAISIKHVPDKYTDNHLRDMITISGAKFVPDIFDEVIVEFVSDTDSVPYYWVMFKKEGVFVLNKDITEPNFLSDSENDTESLEEVRAIPMSELSGIARLIRNHPYEVVFNCTDSQWQSIM